MNQVLSQNEVDALLAAVSDGDVGNAGIAEGDSSSLTAEGKTIVSYDLASQDKIIRARFPQLDVIYEKFMRAFRVSLSSTIRKIATINNPSTEFVKFGEYVNTLPMPTCLSVLRFNNLRGSAVLAIESRLAYAFVDSFLGGADRPYNKVEGKEFTQIELTILRKVVDLVIQDLGDAWSSIEDIDCSFVRTEINPQFVGIVPPTDIVLATSFDVELENETGTITIVVPYSTIEPIKQKLSSGFQAEADQTDKRLWTTAIEKQLLDTEVDVKVNLGKTEIDLQKLMNLKEGDIIPLDQEATGEFDLMVEGVQKFKAYHGTYHGAVAVQITRPIKK